MARDLSPNKPATAPEPALTIAEQAKKLRVLRVDYEEAEAVAAKKRAVFKEAARKLSSELAAERHANYREGRLTTASYASQAEHALRWLDAGSQGYSVRAEKAFIAILHEDRVVARLQARVDIRGNRLVFAYDGRVYTYLADAVHAVLKAEKVQPTETAPAVLLGRAVGPDTPTLDRTVSETPNLGLRRFNEDAEPREAAEPTNWRERLHAWWSPSVWDEKAFDRAALLRAKLDWLFRLFRRRDSADAKLARANAAAEMLRGSN
jgi:hypothetical protein